MARALISIVAAMCLAAPIVAGGEPCGFGDVEAYGQYASSGCPLGDLDGDGDGDLDLVVAGSGNLSVLLNLGDGTFPTHVNYGGVIVSPAALGDLDGDLDVDIAVASGDGISVWFGNGDGTFVAGAVAYGVNGCAGSTAIGDLDGDLDLDLAVASCDDVAVLLNNGDGTFAVQVRYFVGNAIEVAMGDLEGDDDLDLVVTNNLDGVYDDFSVLLNNGDGTMAPEVSYATDDGPWGVAIGDLDGDLDLDVAIATEDCCRVNVFMNDGNAIFTYGSYIFVGVEAYDIAMADFDGNGSLDLVNTNRDDNNVSVTLNNGDGTFGTDVLYATGVQPRGVAAGDVNGDGMPDIVAATSVGSTAVSVLLNLCPALCPGDIDGSTNVDSDDLITLLVAWGSCENCPADIDLDGVVGFHDLLMLLGSWGPCPQ